MEFFRVTCTSCQTFDIADDVLTWLAGNTEATNMTNLVAAASRRKADTDGRLRIETDLDYVFIAAEEAIRQAPSRR